MLSGPTRRRATGEAVLKTAGTEDMDDGCDVDQVRAKVTGWWPG